MPWSKLQRRYSQLIADAGTSTLDDPLAERCFQLRCAAEGFQLPTAGENTLA